MVCVLSDLFGVLLAFQGLFNRYSARRTFQQHRWFVVFTPFWAPNTDGVYSSTFSTPLFSILRPLFGRKGFVQNRYRPISGPKGSGRGADCNFTTFSTPPFFSLRPLRITKGPISGRKGLVQNRYRLWGLECCWIFHILLLFRPPYFLLFGPSSVGRDSFKTDIGRYRLLRDQAGELIAILRLFQPPYFFSLRPLLITKGPISGRKDFARNRFRF